MVSLIEEKDMITCNESNIFMSHQVGLELILRLDL